MIWLLIFLFSFHLMATDEALGSDMHLFAGAGLRRPVEKLVEDFQRQTGHNVSVDYGGSGQLLARILASGQGDLFMPGSLFYIDKLKALGKIGNFRPVVEHTPVVAVNKAKAQDLTSFEDLARPGVRLALGDPKAMALGRTTMRILERAGALKNKILANTVVYGATVKQLALYVAEGSADASIIGRADAIQFRGRVVMVPIPKGYFDSEIVAVAVLRSAKDQKAAADLMEFLSSAKAVDVFQSFGFLPLE
jgi:molybdate transport system substrate-binding protein